MRSMNPGERSQPRPTQPAGLFVPAVKPSTACDEYVNARSRPEPATSGGFGTSPAYHAAKGAVRTLTKNTALHWADKGIRVNSVHPGFIDTPILASTKGTEFEQAMIGLTPMGRLGRPQEIAAGVAYLASDDASFVTGLELYIDGGSMAR